MILRVKDSGIGMTPETVSRVFEPFYTTKGVGEGTGLGLSVCHGIVTQSNGFMEVESALGVGTTFTVYLPRVYQPSDELPIRDDQGFLPSGSESILLVEDEPAVRKMISEVLRRQGYAVTEASNGAEALSMAQGQTNEAIDLLLTDVVMPLMGGVELADHIRKLHPETKVLYTSGYVEEVAERHAVVGEGDGSFLRKPITLRSLALKVRETLSIPPLDR